MQRSFKNKKFMDVAVLSFWKQQALFIHKNRFDTNLGKLI